MELEEESNARLADKSESNPENNNPDNLMVTQKNKNKTEEAEGAEGKV